MSGYSSHTPKVKDVSEFRVCLKVVGAPNPRHQWRRLARGCRFGTRVRVTTLPPLRPRSGLHPARPQSPPRHDARAGPSSSDTPEGPPTKLPNKPVFPPQSLRRGIGWYGRLPATTLWNFRDASRLFPAETMMALTDDAALHSPPGPPASGKAGERWLWKRDRQPCKTRALGHVRLLDVNKELKTHM